MVSVQFLPSEPNTRFENGFIIIQKRKFDRFSQTTARALRHVWFPLEYQLICPSSCIRVSCSYQFICHIFDILSFWICDCRQGAYFTCNFAAFNKVYKHGEGNHIESDFRSRFDAQRCGRWSTQRCSGEVFRGDLCSVG